MWKQRVPFYLLPVWHGADHFGKACFRNNVNILIEFDFWLPHDSNQPLQLIAWIPTLKQHSPAN
jgi:hypothetical protein